jgi:hypothetical protein
VLHVETFLQPDSYVSFSVLSLCIRELWGEYLCSYTITLLRIILSKGTKHFEHYPRISYCCGHLEWKRKIILLKRVWNSMRIALCENAGVHRTLIPGDYSSRARGRREGSEGREHSLLVRWFCSLSSAQFILFQTNGKQKEKCAQSEVCGGLC